LPLDAWTNLASSAKLSAIMRALVLLGLCASLAACGGPAKPIPPARESGELVVVTRNGPTTYYEDAEGAHVGLEHDLVQMFARELGFEVRWIVATQFQDILPTVIQRQAHFAASGMTITDERKRRVSFSTAYQPVQEQVVYNTDGPRPKSFSDLVGRRLQVVAGTSYVDQLKQAQRKHPQLTWEEVRGRETEELLQRVADGEVDYVIADSHIVLLSQNYYPKLGVAFDVGKPEYLAWAFPKDGDAWLYKKSIEFFAKIQRDGTLKRLLDRYYGHIERLESADVVGFLEKMNRVLPRYRDLFQRAQEETGIDWRLLAALGYQESKWDPLATSPTGVRGLMMLTEQTADHMRVTDRLDPGQSIRAGAKYFLNLKDTLPAPIPEPDRTWLALAAYNVGYGHLEDARVLGQRLGMNPDSWADMKKALPLLAKSEYHTTVKHGFARGGEAVILTENIRTYYDILLKFEKPHKPFFSPFSQNKSNSKEKVSLR
jgi:membrane-bound lytic murein transglycosylase F